MRHPQLGRGGPGAKVWSPTDPLATETLVTQLVARMSLEREVGQIDQGRHFKHQAGRLRAYKRCQNSICAGGNSRRRRCNRLERPAAAWVQTAPGFPSVSLLRTAGAHADPVMFGVDAVHGQQPRWSALRVSPQRRYGRRRRRDLVRRIGEATAQETAATGFDWAFGRPGPPAGRALGPSLRRYYEDPADGGRYAARWCEGCRERLARGGRAQKEATSRLGQALSGRRRHPGRRRSGTTPDISEAERIRVTRRGYRRRSRAGADDGDVFAFERQA